MPITPAGMAGEAVLLYPRSQLQQGRFTDAMSAFYNVGERLLNDHVLFDVLPDDIATPDKLARYKTNLYDLVPAGTEPSPMKGSAASKRLRAFACLPVVRKRAPSGTFTL